MAQVIRRASFPKTEIASNIVEESASLQNSPPISSSGPISAAAIAVAASPVKKGGIEKDVGSSFDKGHGGITLSFSDSMNDQTEYTLDLEEMEKEREKQEKEEKEKEKEKGRIGGRNGPKVVKGQTDALTSVSEEETATLHPPGVPEGAKGDGEGGGGGGGEEDQGVAGRSKRSSASEKESDRVTCGDSIVDCGWFEEGKAQDKEEGKEDGKEGGEEESAGEQPLPLSSLLERSRLLDECEREIENSEFMASYNTHDDCGDDACATDRQSEHEEGAHNVSDERKQEVIVVLSEGVVGSGMGDSNGQMKEEGEKEGEKVKGEKEGEKVKEKVKEGVKGKDEEKEKEKKTDSTVVDAVAACKKALHKENAAPIFDALLYRKSISEGEMKDGERRKSKDADDLSAMSGNVSAISSLGGTLRSSTVHRAFRDYIAAEGEASDKCVSYVSSNSSSAFFSLSCSPSTPFPVLPLSYFTEPRLSASSASGCDLPFAPKFGGTSDNSHEEKESSGGEKGSTSSIEEGIAYEYATTGRDNDSENVNGEDLGPNGVGSEGTSLSGKQSSTLFNSLQNVGSNKHGAHSIHRDSHSFKSGANKSSRSSKRISGNTANSGQNHGGDHAIRPNNISLPGSIDKSDLSIGRRVRNERRTRENNTNGHSNRVTGDHHDDNSNSTNGNSNSSSTAADRTNGSNGNGSGSGNGSHSHSHKERNIKNTHSNIHSASDNTDHQCGTNARDDRTNGSSSGASDPMSLSGTKSSSTKKLLQDLSLSIFPSSFKRSHNSFVSNMRLKTENEKIT